MTKPKMVVIALALLALLLPLALPWLFWARLLVLLRWAFRF